MKGLFGIFFEIEKKRSVAVLALLVLASVAESFGIVNILPALSLAIEDGSMTTPIIKPLSNFVTWIGLTPSFETFLLLTMVGILLKTILRQVAMSYVGYTVAQLTASFRAQLIQALFLARWSYFTRIQPGRLANALSGEVKRAGESYMMTASLFSMQAQMLAYLIAGLFVSWQAMLAAITAGCLIALALSFLIRASKRYGRNQTRHISNFIGYLNDTLINIRPIKAMSKHPAMRALLVSRLSKVKRAQQKDILVSEGMTNLSEALQTIMLCSGFYVAIKVFDVSVAETATIGLLIVQTMKYFSKALKQYQNIANRQASYENVRTLIDECTAQAESNNGTLTKVLEQELHLEHVAYAYENFQVLQDINLTIPKGQRVVLCGPSGSGKSTLADIVMGFIRPQGGRITVDGTPLHEIELTSWRKQIGYVPQEPTLFNDSVYTNVTLMDPELTEEDAWNALRMAGAEEFVRDLPEGLHAPVGERGSLLSGGQRQRIAIARALIGHPKLMILDEVTSALDPDSETRIVAQIKSLNRSITIIAITHRQALLEIADDVYHIVNGQLERMDQTP